MRLIHILVVALLGATPAFAQQPKAADVLERGTIVSPILTIESKRAFEQSAFGKRVAAEVEAEGEKLASENRIIEADLETEEKELTALRAELPAEEFRVLADAFDAKVQETRATQAAKGRALSARFGREEVVFRNAAGPVLDRLMREAGAAVILERRSVYDSLDAIDITDDAVSLLDETLGSGEAQQP
jgi:Skp family chaperone for outer membrane proteins